MERLHHIATGLLLAALAVSMGAAPTVHRVQHAVQDAAASVHTHEDADHPLWCGHPAHEQTLDCALCTTRLVVAPPSGSVATTSLAAAASPDLTVKHLVSSAVVAVPLIRGPPTVG
jgi:hypothetical protein